MCEHMCFCPFVVYTVHVSVCEYVYMCVQVWAFGWVCVNTCLCIILYYAEHRELNIGIRLHTTHTYTTRIL